MQIIQSHLINTRMSRYRPVGLSARRNTGRSSRVYGGRVPTPQSGQRAITLWAVYDLPSGRHTRSLKYTVYDGVAPVPPEQKIMVGVTHGHS